MMQLQKDIDEDIEDVLRQLESAPFKKTQADFYCPDCEVSKRSKLKLVAHLKPFKDHLYVYQCGVCKQLINLR
jgi:transcription elongation factor Elf1